MNTVDGSVVIREMERLGWKKYHNGKNTSKRVPLLYGELTEA